jgi:flagellar hook-associated protein 2
MAFRAGGLASGIDSKTLIASLMQIERQPVNRLSTKRRGHQTQISKIGTIKSAASGLITAAKAIDTAKELLTVSATSSETDSFTATADGTAVVSNYDVTVSQVATAEKNRSVAIATTTTAIKEGTITITVNGETAQNFTISDGDVITNVVDTLNTGTGFTAALINDGTSYYLTVTSEETGHTIGGTASDALAITVAQTGATGVDLNLTETVTAANAKLTVDGLSVESESNDASGFIPGVTVHVKTKTTEIEKLTLSVDKDETKKKVQTFIDAYNKVVSLIQREMKVPVGTNRGHTLNGDSIILNMKNTLYNYTIPPVASLSGAKFATLAAIGVKGSRAGTLSIDTKKFEAALDTNPKAFTKVFTETDGVANRLIPVLESYTQIGGQLANRTEGINARIRQLDKTITRLNNRLDQYENSLVRQFTSLELAVSKINSQGNYLASALG